ncbi:MAG: hypothetical protein AAF798_19570 [Bacteroidota bacterium]
MIFLSIQRYVVDYSPAMTFITLAIDFGQPLPQCPTRAIRSTQQCQIVRLHGSSPAGPGVVFVLHSASSSPAAVTIWPHFVPLLSLLRPPLKLSPQAQTLDVFA